VISQEKADFIRSLANEHGFIEPSDLVAAARPKNSVLHDEFEWNSEKAAEAHRIDTARRLIRYVRIELIINEQVINAVGYVSDPNRPSKSRRYVDLTIVAANEMMRQEVLMAELTRIVAQIRRAQEVAAVLGLSRQLAGMLSDVEALLELAQQRAEAQRQRRREAQKQTRAQKKLKKKRPQRRRPSGPSELRV
jgi:hypothetical protein